MAPGIYLTTKISLPFTPFSPPYLIPLILQTMPQNQSRSPPPKQRYRKCPYETTIPHSRILYLPEGRTASDSPIPAYFCRASSCTPLLAKRKQVELAFSRLSHLEAGVDRLSR